MKKNTEEDIQKYLSKKTVAEKNEVYKHLYTMMVKTKMEGTVASHKERAERRDNYPYLAKITIPTLVIAGVCS